MSGLNPDQVPALRRGFRFQWEPAQNCHVLLYPEGMIKLNDSAGAILAEMRRRRSVAAIVADLSARFPRCQRHAPRTSWLSWRWPMNVFWIELR